MTATTSKSQTLRIRPVEAFSDNYIWLIDDGKHAVVVDPGDAMPVIDQLETDGLSLTAILLTHHHNDHVGGVLDLLKEYRAKVYGPAMEILPACDVSLTEGDTVTIDEPALSLRVLDVPGHTAGHIAFTGSIGGKPVLFCGDTLFVGGCGRLFEGTPTQMLDSLDKFAALPEQTEVYCAHEYTLSNLRWALTVEPQNAELQAFELECAKRRQVNQPTVPSTIATEKLCNPFMRARQSSVTQAASQRAGHLLATPVEVFATLRTWKNEFR